jgi:hypothetical protein
VTAEDVLQRHDRAIRGLLYGKKVAAGRESATISSAVSWSAATAWTAAGGPTAWVQVGPSGRLAITVTARLSGTGGRTLMGWQVTGPYLDANSTPIHGAPAATTAADESRALAVSSGEVTASHTSELIGLTPGWYVVDCRYSTTGTAGSATYRQLLAEPV